MSCAAQAWNRLHPRLTHRTCWLDHHGELPVIEGTLIRLQVEHLPGDRDPKPVWLWWSAINQTPADVDRCWKSFLRRFDLEHTFRLFKQTLGWTRPRRSARTANQAIETTGRRSLAEMRRLLGPSLQAEAELTPLPGIGELPALADAR